MKTHTERCLYLYQRRLWITSKSPKHPFGYVHLYHLRILKDLCWRRTKTRKPTNEWDDWLIDGVGDWPWCDRKRRRLQRGWGSAGAFYLRWLCWRMRCCSWCCCAGRRRSSLPAAAPSLPRLFLCPGGGGWPRFCCGTGSKTRWEQNTDGWAQRGCLNAGRIRFLSQHRDSLSVVLIRIAVNLCFCSAGTFLTFWLGAPLWEVQHIKIH